VDNTTGEARLAFGPETFPLTNKGKAIDPVAGGWNDLDGFSPLPAITTYFEGVSDENVSLVDAARFWNIERSLESDSPTMLVNARTNKPVAHWVELDHSSDKAKLAPHGKRAFMIWPAERLSAGERYIVAIRNIPGATASAAFRALQAGDGGDGGGGGGLARALHYQALFSQLERGPYAAVDRADLQITWDFTVGSRQQFTKRMVTARDDSRKRMRLTGGPLHTVTKVTEDFQSTGRRKVEGVMEVPQYLNQAFPGPLSRLVIDDATGAPVFQHMGTVPFEILIPASVLNGSVARPRFLQYGHGLFGDKSEVETGYLRDDAERFGCVPSQTCRIRLNRTARATSARASAQQRGVHRPSRTAL
jgi:hypothetical protein